MIEGRTIAVLVAAGALALAVGFATNYILHGPGLGPQGVSEEADVASLFAARLPDLTGTETSLAQWRGKILVVNFWATWCGPCREEIPDFIRLQGEFGTKDVQFVGIAADQVDKILLFASEFKVNYPLLVGSYGALDLARRLGNRVSALPFTVVLDRDGRLVHRELGVLNQHKLRSILSKLL